MPDFPEVPFDPYGFFEMPDSISVWEGGLVLYGSYDNEVVIVAESCGATAEGTG